MNFVFLLVEVFGGCDWTLEYFDIAELNCYCWFSLRQRRDFISYCLHLQPPSILFNFNSKKKKNKVW